MNNNSLFNLAWTIVFVAALLSLPVTAKTVTAGGDNSAVATVNGAPVVAMVLDKNGPWQVQKGDQSFQLKRGDGVPKDYLLQPLTPDSTIVLVSTDGKILTYPGNLNIKQPMAAAAPDTVTPITKWWSKMVRIFTSQPPGSVIEVSRDLPGPGCIALHDAVIKRSSTNLDIRPIFQDEPNGQFQLEVDRLNPDGSVYIMGEPAAITFAKGSPDLVNVPNLSDGLYRVAVTPQDGQTTGDDAWILVRSPASYDKVAQAFKTVVDNATTSQEISPGGIRWFLRTDMAILNRQMP